MWQSAPVSPPADESGLISAQLIDLGSAQLIGAEPSQPNFYPLGLRSPELLLRAGLGYEADIWAMGHLAFELLTGQTLFQVTERYNPLSSQMEVDLPDILAQMMEISGDSFSTGSGAAIKKTALDWSNFFDIEDSHLIHLVRP
ncbi:hypothetical protein EUX98_g4500 [Antrodiella citrinella]|uniref:Protein kinase domain-containing protein n=1 Tax=Antrodiella citrinella TaxID=2447956 RepID=A0A4S4MWL7_9APHY|nr:hypothetical protein EUX98_g4500 [Antrodiella citrinella]